jgi:3-oxoacyl-[acyl-carrier-protein] synthase III
MSTPDVAAALGLGHIPAFDVGAICSGFIYAAATAQGLIAAGTARRVLVIGTETMSHVLHPSDRNTRVIFGDGAGAVVVRAGDPDEPGAFGPFDLGADGSGSDLIRIDASGGRLASSSDEPDEQDRYMVMEGREVYRRAIPAMAESSTRAAVARGWSVEDIDVVIGHQANVRILDAVAERLGLPTERSFTNLDRVGNTSAASIPIAMVDADRSGAVSPGDKMLLTAFGAGLTWGSTTLTWPQLPDSSR